MDESVPPDTLDNSSGVPHLSFLFISGRRYDLNIDKRFLEHENIEKSNPQDVTVAAIRAALVSNWEADWGEPPANADCIRLIHLGRMMEDTSRLSEFNLDLSDVVHVSVRPANIAPPSKPKNKLKSKHNRRGGTHESTGEAPDAIAQAAARIAAENGTRSSSGCCVLM